jgi:Ca-activated chloride channel family protein
MSLRGPSRLMVLAALVVTAGATLDAQRFTSRAVAVRVDVLVTNGGQLVRGLSARDFDVRDEGVPQTVSQVELEQIPLNLILVFDTSGSVAGDRMRALLEAGKALLDGLRDQDRVALVSFSTRVRLLTPLTSNRQQIRAAFDTLEAHDATSLRDAAFAGLALRETDPGRTLLLIFSDGDDTSSWLTTPRVIETAKRTDAVVYAVAVPFQRAFWTPQNGATIATVKEAGKFLESLTEETGGRILFASSNSDLRATFTKTLAEFHDRYVLSYTPTGVSATGWHRLEVKLKGKSGKVTARRGYFGE